MRFYHSDRILSADVLRVPCPPAALTEERLRGESSSRGFAETRSGLAEVQSSANLVIHHLMACVCVSLFATYSIAGMLKNDERDGCNDIWSSVVHWNHTFDARLNFYSVLFVLTLRMTCV